MKKNKSAIILLFVCSLLVLGGCASFKSDIEGKFESPGEKNYGADGVRVLFVFSHLRQTIGYDAIPKLDNERQRISGFDDFFQDGLNELSNVKEFSIFTEYASDINEPERRTERDSLMACHDYIMKVRFMRTKSFARHFLGKIASTVSLTLLPIPYTYSYSIQVDLHDSGGCLIETYSRSASLTKWVETFMIFVYPFHPEKRKNEEIYVDFLHDVFRQIESERILGKTQG